MMESCFFFSTVLLAFAFIFGLGGEHKNSPNAMQCILIWISGLLFGWGAWLAVKALGA